MKLTRMIEGVTVAADHVVTVECTAHPDPVTVTHIGHWPPPPGHTPADMPGDYGTRVVDLDREKSEGPLIADWVDTAGCLQTPHGEAVKAGRGQRAIRDPRPMLAGDPYGAPRSMTAWRWRFQCSGCGTTVLVSEPKMSEALDMCRRLGVARLSIQAVSASL